MTMAVQETKIYTRAEVEEHNNEKDIWMIIENNVYDITKYLYEHPGGEEVLLEYAGKDGTEAFIEIGHSSEARELLGKFLIGELIETEKSYVKYSDKRSTKRKVKLVAPFFISSVLIIGAFVAYRIYRR